jgi:hypothetical protein
MDELWMVLESSERRRHSDFLLDVQLELGIFDEISLLWSERTSSSASQPRLKVDEASLDQGISSTLPTNPRRS